MRKTILAALAASALSGCAHDFVPGPGTSVLSLEPDKATCRLMARGMESGYSFGAYGSPKFVAISTGVAGIFYGVSAAVEQATNYDDCMMAKGYQIAERATTTQPIGRREFLVRAIEVTPAMAEAHHLPHGGVAILRVDPNGAAASAGLRADDVIVSFNGVPVHGGSDIERALSEVAPSQKVVAMIWRAGGEQSVEVQF